jgi:ElaB/YqjD/DUF883 family membrane-anchored ribosome-binding protein
MPEEQDIHTKPTRAVVEDVIQQSHQALESGARLAAEVDELTRRADNVLDWRMQVQRHPWLPLGAAAGVAVLFYLVFSKR